MRPLQRPRLPQGPVAWALVSGEYPWLGEELARRGVRALTTQADRRLPQPVQFHPDLQACPLPFEQMFVLQNSPLIPALGALGFQVEETTRAPSSAYPADALCGGFPWGSWLVGNPQALDGAILAGARRAGLEQLPVKQGYSACSVALVDESAAITADRGLYRALTAQGFQVLLIQPGHIQLPGYDTGFIGGCCGKLAPDKLAFAGALSSHPDGEAIRLFLKSRGVEAVELRDAPLLDVGGILPLVEAQGARWEKGTGKNTRN